MSRSSFAKASISRALTLIEVVVVLAILAVLAGVAVRSLEPLADQTRYEVTQKTLETAKSSIVEDRRLTSGTRQVSGFVSDIGKLPESTWMLIDSAGATSFTVPPPPIANNASEPVIRHVSVDRRGLDSIGVRTTVFSGTDHSATRGSRDRFVRHVIESVPLSSFSFADRVGPAASTPPANPTTVDCSGVSLRCGWRGPYLTVADPLKGVVDGWGRELGLFGYPNAADETHLVWTAVTNQYTDQVVNVQRLAFQTVSGIIQDTNGAAKVSEVVLVYPDPLLSTATLSVMADADGQNNDNRFRFDNVPVGVRALVFNEVGGTGQSIRYIEVTPMQQANLTISVTEF